MKAEKGTINGQTLREIVITILNDRVFPVDHNYTDCPLHETRMKIIENLETFYRIQYHLKTAIEDES